MCRFPESARAERLRTAPSHLAAFRPRTPFCRMVAAGVWTVLIAAPVAALQADRDEVVRIEHAQAAAVVAVDLPVLEAIYADDFVFTHGTGEVQTKAEWLDDLRTGRRVYGSRVVTDVDVELHGDIAVTYGRLEIRLRRDGQDQHFSARYVRVYGRRAGRWQLVSHRTIEQRALTPAGGG